MKITNLAMIGLSLGIPVVMVAPKFLEARESNTIRIGSPCDYQGRGGYQVVDIKDGKYTIRTSVLDPEIIVTKDEICISPDWIPDEHKWYTGVFGH